MKSGISMPAQTSSGSLTCPTPPRPPSIKPIRHGSRFRMRATADPPMLPLPCLLFFPLALVFFPAICHTRSSLCNRRGKKFRLGTVSMATRWNFSILLLVTSTARAESKRMQPSEQGARFAALRTLCADKTCVCMAAARPLVFAHCLPWAVASVTSGRGVQSDSSERVSYSGVVAALLGRLLTTATSRRR